MCLSSLVGLSSFLVLLWMPVQKVKGCREQEECICLSGFCLLFSLFNCTKNQWLLKARFIYELDDWFFVIGSMANNHCTVLKCMWSLQEPILICGVREGKIDHEPFQFQTLSVHIDFLVNKCETARRLLQFCFEFSTVNKQYCCVSTFHPSSNKIWG